jgi:hypothetical protein
MDIMIKVNRALRDSSIQVISLNNGEEKTAERSFVFYHDGKRIPITIKLKKTQEATEPAVQLILWETAKKLSGKSFGLDQVQQHIPGFKIDHPLFSSELELMKKRASSPSMEERRQMEDSFLNRYPE